MEDSSTTVKEDVCSSESGSLCVEATECHEIKAEKMISDTTKAMTGDDESPPPLVSVAEASSESSGSGSGDGTCVEPIENDEQLAEGCQNEDFDNFTFQFKLDLNADEKQKADVSEENQVAGPDEDFNLINLDDGDDEDQWDFSLKKLNKIGPEYKTIWVSDKEFIKTLTSMNAFGSCDHEPIKITCPCEKEVKFSVCFKCHLVFCSAKCSRFHKIKPKNSEGSNETASNADVGSSDGMKSSTSLSEGDILSTGTGTSMVANHGSVDEEDETSTSTSESSAVRKGVSQPTTLNTQAESSLSSGSETKPDKGIMRNDARQTVSPKSKHATTTFRKSRTDSFPNNTPKESVVERDRRLMDQVMQTKLLEGQQAVLAGFSCNPMPFNSQPGTGLLPFPNSFVDKTWPRGPPIPMMPGYPAVRQWGPPLMPPLPGMNGNIPIPRFTPRQTQNNFNRYRQPGFHNVKQLQFDPNRDEGKVERDPNPRNTHQLNNQPIRGTRREIPVRYLNENQATNNNHNFPKEDSRYDVDEDLRFHERHTSNESDSVASNTRKDYNQDSNPKRGKNNSYTKSSLSQSVGQNQVTGNQRSFREQERRRNSGDASSQPSSKSRSSNDSMGEKLLKMVQTGKSPDKPLFSNSSNHFSQNSPVRVDVASSNCDTLDTSSLNSNPREPESYKHRTKPIRSTSHNAGTPIGMSNVRNSKHVPEITKSKHSSSIKKISQHRKFLFDIPIMVGHSYGETIYDFFAFDSEGGLDRGKIENAINGIEEFSPLASFHKDSYCLAMYAADECWYRGRILDVSSDEKTAVVFFIDYGNQEVVDRKHVCEIPDKLQEFYPAVINISNVDFMPHLDRAAELIMSNNFDDYIKNEWFRVTIVREDNALSKAGFPMYKVKIDITVENLWINYGNLLERFDVGKLNRNDPNSTPRFRSSEQVVLDRSTELPILISNVTSLNDFDAIKRKHADLRDEISKTLETYDEKPVYPMNAWPESDFVCAAKRKGEKWARARILMITKEPNTVEVKFIDYGDTAFVTTRNLKSLSSELLQTPQLSFKCSLPIFPVEETWDEEWMTLFKAVADAGPEGKTAVHLYSKEIDPQVIYIVEVFTGSVKDGLAKTVLQRSEDKYECVYEVDLDVRHHRG